MLFLNIRKYRHIKRLTQEELGNMVGVSQYYISQLEKGNLRKVSPTLKVLESIASALDVCICDLIYCGCPKCQQKREES